MRRMLAPIVTNKHYTYRSNAAVASGAALLGTIVQAIVAPGVANDFSVTEGSVVKAVHVEYWLKSSASAGEDTQFNFYIYKDPGGKNAMVFADGTNAGAYDNKKNILFSSQGVIGDLTTQSIPVIREWIKIPKGKQRFGLGDKLSFMVSFTGFAGQICGMATYKEYK